MSPEESERLHLDWWGKCRTCKWWEGRDPNRLQQVGATMLYADCSNQITFPGGTGLTTQAGYCPEWDSFDEDTALKILTRDEKK